MKFGSWMLSNFSPLLVLRIGLCEAHQQVNDRCMLMFINEEHHMRQPNFIQMALKSQLSQVLI